MYLPDTFFFLLELPLLQMAIRSHHPIKNVCVLGLTVIIYANKSCLQPEAANKVTTHGASRYFKFKAESQARNWLPGISLLIISICIILLGIKAHSLFINITSPFQAGVIQSKAKQRLLSLQPTLQRSGMHNLAERNIMIR
jgi:hypothetical protein